MTVQEGDAWLAWFDRPDLSMQWKCQNHPAHDVPRLEIPFRTIRVGIMATDARLRDRFVGIQGLEHGRATVARHCHIRAIGIEEDFRQAVSLKLGRRPVLFVDCPIAD